MLCSTQLKSFWWTHRASQTQALCPTPPSPRHNHILQHPIIIPHFSSGLKAVLLRSPALTAKHVLYGSPPAAARSRRWQTDPGFISKHLLSALTRTSGAPELYGLLNQPNRQPHLATSSSSLKENHIHPGTQLNWLQKQDQQRPTLTAASSSACLCKTLAVEMRELLVQKATGLAQL